MTETEPSYHEIADKNNDNSEWAQINKLNRIFSVWAQINEFNRIFSDFQRLNNRKISDKNGNSFKCSYDIKEDKWGSWKTIIVEMDENNETTLIESIASIFGNLWLNYFGDYKQNETQKMRQQYTEARYRKTVNKVRYYISMNERVTTNWEKITTFQQTREYLDIKNHPREIKWISWLQVLKMLSMCNDVVKTVETCMAKKHYAANQESVRKDQQAAEDLLKNN